MKSENVNRNLSILSGVLCVSMLSVYLLAPVRAAGNEDTFEFTNDEAEDAYDLHIEWSRAVTIKQVIPFKKTSGSGSNNTSHTKGVVSQGAVASVSVTWEGTAPSIGKWWWSKKDGSRLGKEKTGNPATANIQSAVGLHIATFATRQGKIKVYLPDDIRAGDTISGTVVTEPTGRSVDERSKNLASLAGYVIEVGDLKTSSAKPNFSWVVPRTQPLPQYILRIVEVRGGTTVDVGPLPVGPVTDGGTAGAHSGFVVPVLGQAGRSVEITGPFDGNSANTTLRFGPARSTVQDFEKTTEGVANGFGLLRPLAESPGKVVFESPANVTGPLEILVKEGEVATHVPYRNVGVQLNAPKTSLLRGERTTLRIEVVGLEGMTNDLPLHLETSGVIQMDGGNSQNVTIHPADIQSGGRFATTREIMGQQAGAFTCTATVVVQAGLSKDVKSKDELLEELQDLRERKKYDCEHGREYQQAFADRIAVIKRVLRSFHGQHILNDPIDENCPPK